MAVVVPDCGSENWIEVAHFNMSEQCPSSWTMASYLQDCALLPCLGTVQELLLLRLDLWASNRICFWLTRCLH